MQGKQNGTDKLKAGCIKAHLLVCAGGASQQRLSAESHLNILWDSGGICPTFSGIYRMGLAANCGTNMVDGAQVVC